MPASRHQIEGTETSSAQEGMPASRHQIEGTETSSAQEGMSASRHQIEENELLWPHHQAQHIPTRII